MVIKADYSGVAKHVLLQESYDLSATRKYDAENFPTSLLVIFFFVGKKCIFVLHDITALSMQSSKLSMSTEC